MPKVICNSEAIKAMKFNKPTQVRFHLECEDINTGMMGIAYKDEVICLCCGAVNRIDEIDVIETYDCDWINVNNAVERTMFYDD